MGKLVNINGQEIELEDFVVSEQSENYYDIVDIPEEEQFINEYIEKDMDANPIDDIEFNKLIDNLQDPETMPSCLSIDDWLQTQSEILDIIRLGYQDYIKDYRKELREWWTNKSNRYITNDKGELLMSNGIPISQDDIDASDKVKDIISNSINKSIDKELIS